MKHHAHAALRTSGIVAALIAATPGQEEQRDADAEQAPPPRRSGSWRGGRWAALAPAAGCLLLLDVSWWANVTLSSSTGPQGPLCSGGHHWVCAVWCRVLSRWILSLGISPRWHIWCVAACELGFKKAIRHLSISRHFTPLVFCLTANFVLLQSVFARTQLIEALEAKYSRHSHDQASHSTAGPPAPGAHAGREAENDRGELCRPLAHL
jgi:hypothetical protein